MRLGVTKFRVVMTIEVGTTGPIGDWLPGFMQLLMQRANPELQPATVEHGLDVHRWRPIHNFDGSWAGQILIQCASNEEVLQLHQTVHGAGVRIQHHLAIIEVSCPHVDLTTSDRALAPVYDQTHGGRHTAPIPMPTP